MNCDIGKSQVSDPERPKSYWTYSHSDSLLSLYVDSSKIQDLYLINGGIDSFRVYDQTNGVVFPLKVDEIGFDSVFSAFISEIEHTDSFLVTIWKPVRKGYTYQVSVFKDGSFYKELKFEDNPLPSFHIPKEKTRNQIYTVKYTIYKDRKRIFGPYIYQPIKFKKGLLDHG
jgi:hypothetical protein